MRRIPRPDRKAIDPIARFQRLFEETKRRREPIPEAMALATASGEALPSVRFVLLKQLDRRGLLFFTDERSRKGNDLRRNPRAAAVFYWHRTEKQVRVEGRIEPASREETDAYWQTRPRSSRISALASRQSAEMLSRRDLLETVRRLRRELRGRPIPRPSAWVGYRIVPERIEFWSRRLHRLHHRELFVRSGEGWKQYLLEP